MRDDISADSPVDVISKSFNPPLTYSGNNHSVYTTVHTLYKPTSLIHHHAAPNAAASGFDPREKSLHLAQKALNCRNIEKVMESFVKINLSPVTISERHEVKHLENLYSYFL